MRPKASHISLALVLIGAVALMSALIWWALVFGIILNAGVLSWREAGICMVDSSGLCQAIATLCLQSHPLNIRVYSPGLLYLSLALLGAGALAGLIAEAASSRNGPPSTLAKS